MSLKGIKVGFGMSGSFCTFQKAFEQAKRLTELGAELTPVMSFNAAGLDTRFGKAQDNVKRIEEICQRSAILTLEAAEPIGPKKLFDIFIVCPCTSTTMSKLANGIYDTPVTLGAKSHLRTGKPVLICASTNDALAAAARNIGALLNFRNYYFVPLSQDAPDEKPYSLSADFSKLPEAAQAALDGVQLQPILNS